MGMLTRYAGALLLVASLSAPAGALFIDFEGPSHGTVVTNQFAGVTLSTVNVGGGPSRGVIFDSERSGTADPDLERGWAAGNLAPSTVLRNLLIIQENDVGCATGVCSRPDDEGTRAAGSFTLSFTQSYRSFALDLVDIEDATAEKGSLEFFLGGASVGLVGFEEFVNPGSFFDPSVQYGNNSANRIAPILVGGFGIADSFDEVVVSMGGSGAIDNISAAIPEPGAALLFAVGFASVAATRSGRRRF